MKLAVPYENEDVFEHFGKASNFKVYNIEDNRVVSTIVIPAEGEGHAALSEQLSKAGVDIVLCGGIGEHAREALEAAKIRVFAGLKGKADHAVEGFLGGSMDGCDACCGCADGECGDQGCGGCCGSQPGITGKNVGKVCVVHYKGTFNDGSVFDSSYDRGQPLEFACGAGMMIRGFDAAVANMDRGDIVNVHLMPEEAYGPVYPQAIMVIPLEDLPGAEEVELGERVMLADEFGRKFPVRVTAKDEKTITLDANHEMAGRELNFQIELVEVR